MKATIFSSRPSHYFLAIMFLLAPSSLLFFACEKDAIIIDDIQPPPETFFDRPDEVQDLVAWYNPQRNVFLVDPSYTEQVLETLKARPFINGTFVMQGINFLGEPTTVRFQIEPVKVPDIYTQAQAAEKILTPELVHTFTEKGTSYRVYKNAECGKVQKGFESGCTNSPDGTSTKNVWYDIRRCERGNGFCVEALGVQGRKVTYHNANCQGPIKSEESYPGYMCW